MQIQHVESHSIRINAVRLGQGDLIAIERERELFSHCLKSPASLLYGTCSLMGNPIDTFTFCLTGHTAPAVRR